MFRTPTSIATVIVLIHAVVAVVHGAAHTGQGIVMPALANAYILVVIMMGPFAGLALLWSRYRTTGAVTLAVTMCGALLFGAWNHFVVASADHVAHLAPGPWRLTFQITAVLLAVTEVAGMLSGLALRRTR